jgi:hypothetical protein
MKYCIYFQAASVSTTAQTSVPQPAVVEETEDEDVDF